MELVTEQPPAKLPGLNYGRDSGFARQMRDREQCTFDLNLGGELRCIALD